jgi:hypothetical protein
MTVNELIMLLEDMDGDTEVRLAMQPSWPFEYSIGGIVRVSSLEDEEYDDEGNGESVVYIGEGTQMGYLPNIVKNELGW